MEWIAARARLREAMFTPLRSAIERLPDDRWPGHAQLCALAEGLVTSKGKPIRFVPPREPTDRERRHYELRIAETGEVETRERNWHDLFNALAWVTFPRAKAAINAQHAAILDERGDAEARRRSPERDALTLFDEGGVIVASSSADVPRLITAFEWKTLFWDRRAELQATTRFFVFGHACYEQALEPYLGMVAKTVFIRVDEALVAWPIDRQLGVADERLARHFADRANFASPKTMAPMPVLGVPGWHPDTSSEVFYDNARYFRSKGPK